MTTIQQNWIKFKTHFCTAHHDLKETNELTMEDSEYHQANLVNGSVANMSGLPLSTRPRSQPINRYQIWFQPSYQPYNLPQ